MGSSPVGMTCFPAGMGMTCFPVGMGMSIGIGHSDGYGTYAGADAGDGAGAVSDD